MKIFNKTILILKKISLFIFAFYSALLFSHLIHLKFKNPDQLLGPLVNLNYNPNNDYLKFYFIIFFTPLFFCLLLYFLKKEKIFFLKLIVIFVGVYSSFIFWINNLYIFKFSNIDMFHDGEFLGPGSGLYLFGKKPYKDIIFLHGAFWNVYIPYISLLIKYSIGSLFFIRIIFIVLSLFLFYLALSFLIKNFFLFLISVIFFTAYPIDQNLGRDLFIFLIIFLIKHWANENRRSGFIKKKLVPFSLGFFSFFSFFYIVDRSLYLFVSVLIFLLFMISFIKKENRLEQFIFYFLGILIAVFLGIIIFGFYGFNEFLNHTFLILPKTSSLMFDSKYPYFSLENIYPYWLPIILLTISLTAVTYYIFYLKKIKLNSQFFTILYLCILNIIYYKAALGRNDEGHILYASHFIFVLIFVLIDYSLKNFKNYFLILILFLLFQKPFFNIQKIFDSSFKYEPYKLKIFLNLPNFDDNYWLNNEQKEVRDFILKNSSKEDYIFVFTNEAAYYYLVKRRNPTRFYTIWFAEPSVYEKEVIKDLERNPPKYIIYKSSYWSNIIDGFKNIERLKLINEWILRKYKKSKIIGTTTILFQ